MGLLQVTMSIDCASQIFVEGTVIGSIGESIRFRSRLSGCTGTITNTNCLIDIYYYWEDTNFSSGNATAVITNGASQTIVTPSLETISYFQINSVSFSSGSCSGYSSSISIC